MIAPVKLALHRELGLETPKTRLLISQICLTNLRQSVDAPLISHKIFFDFHLHNIRVALRGLEPPQTRPILFQICLTNLCQSVDAPLVSHEIFFDFRHLNVRVALRGLS